MSLLELKSQCPICKNQAKIVQDNNTDNFLVKCNICGEYEITTELIEDKFQTFEGVFELDKLSTYLYYNKNTFSLKTMLCQKPLNDNKYFYLSPQIVENWYPKSFAKKIDLILLKLSELSKFNGDYVNVKDSILQFGFCLEKDSSEVDKAYVNDVQIEYIENFLIKQGYVEDEGGFTYQLSPKGLERVYQLQASGSTNKNVFVSMAFNDDTKNTREAIRAGVIKSGFSPEYIDEIIHNHQIMPEMFRLIRECRFLILEISDPNYGAYYEAGYALGLGKEVIICCKEEIFNKEYKTKEYKTKEEKKYAKYLKPHFDIAQKQILVWKDYEDLTKKLSEWIKALF